MRVGLLIICVTVMGCPNELVETDSDVKADGADSVVEPCSSVVVIKKVDENVELKVASVQVPSSMCKKNGELQDHRRI
jgi:hypothetical protein